MAILQKTELKKGRGKALYYAIIGILSIGIPLQIFPFFWMLTNSIKNNSDIISIPPVFFPTEVFWDGFKETFLRYNLWNNILNTAILCIAIIAVQVTISSLAAYSLSKLKPKFGKAILLIFVGTMMISPQALMFPLYLMMAKFPVLGISLINSKWSYILASSAWGYAVFLFKGFFDNFPNELMESAKIDGANAIRIFSRLIVPLSLPVSSVLILNTFLAVYNDFLMPLMLLPNEKNWTLMIRVFMAQASENITPNNLYVLLTVTTIPVVLVYLGAQKNITEGISTTGLKS